MAKVTITISDLEGNIDLNAEFEPGLNPLVKKTGAQKLALSMMQELHTQAKMSGDLVSAEAAGPDRIFKPV